MNIFVIGPEGSGKTVFLTMLSRYIADRDKDLVFQPLDFETGQYVANTLDLLERGKWPKSNPQEDFKTLRWHFGKLDGELHNVTMFDYSGQDMRSVLLTEDVKKLQGQPMELRKKIDESDLLLYLLDMDGLIGSASLGGANENSWLLKTFLTRPGWVDKRRILVVTKADLYSGMIDEAGGDLQVMIEHHCPPTCRPSLSRLKQGKIEFFALTSVGVTTELNDDGNPERKPAVPLVSEGFEELVDAMLGIGEAIAKKRASWPERMKRLIRLGCFALLASVWMSSAGTHQSSGTSCETSGFRKGSGQSREATE